VKAAVDLGQAAIVALGSNLGDSTRILQRAIDRLQGFSTGPLLVSSFWQTDPVDCPPGTPPFTNAVVALTPVPAENAHSLLSRLKKLESEFGRQRTSLRNESRTLDMDLIAFGSEVLSGPELTLPHPRAHERAFVLAPLNEIAPDYVLPLQTVPVRVLLSALGPQLDTVRILLIRGG
jgi:2-amino-4-hydroxy-6-hydroxymethyldihydropteridine diphosphokinase